jgi:hypothetical protein
MCAADLSCGTHNTRGRGNLFPHQQPEQKNMRDEDERETPLPLEKQTNQSRRHTPQTVSNQQDRGRDTEDKQPLREIEIVEP